VNWGLVGLFSFDLVAATFGQMSALSRIVYALVGLAAAYRAFAWAVMKQDPAAGKAQLVC